MTEQIQFVVICVIEKGGEKPFGERTAYSNGKNGLFYLKERLIRMERTAYSNGKNGFFECKERLSALR